MESNSETVTADSPLCSCQTWCAGVAYRELISEFPPGELFGDPHVAPRLNVGMSPRACRLEGRTRQSGAEEPQLHFGACKARQLYGSSDQSTPRWNIRSSRPDGYLLLQKSGTIKQCKIRDR